MNNTAILFGVIILIVVAGFFVFSNMKNTDADFQDPVNLEDIQKVVLSQDDLNYKDVYAEADKPISISADSSVRGCLRAVAFNIDGKKYVKYLKSSSDTLVLPALKKGTYPFSCSMGMGFGKLVIN